MKKITFSSPGLALAMMFLAQCIASIANLSVAPLAPFFQESFHISYVQIGFLTSMLAIGTSLFAIPGGWLVDKIGINNSLLIFGFLLAISYSSLGVFNSYYFSLALMLLIGASYGAMTPITTKSIVQWFDSSKRGLAMSFKQTGVVGGGALASLLIVYFGSMLGWRLTVIVLGILFFFIYLILAFLYKNPPLSKKKEVAQEKPLFWNNLIDLFGNKIFLLLCLIMSLFLWGQFSLSTYLLLFLKDSLHFTLFWAGFGLTIFLVGGVVGRLFWGWVSDVWFHKKREYIILINALIGCVSFVVLSSFVFWNAVIPSWVILLTLFVSGLNIAGWNGVLITLLVGEVASEKAGLASGGGYAIGSLGTMAGVPVTGYIIESSGYIVALSFLSLIFVIIAFLITIVISKKNQLNAYYLNKGAGVK